GDHVQLAGRLAGVVALHGESESLLHGLLGHALTFGLRRDRGQRAERAPVKVGQGGEAGRRYVGHAVVVPADAHVRRRQRIEWRPFLYILIRDVINVSHETRPYGTNPRRWPVPDRRR